MAAEVQAEIAALQQRTHLSEQHGLRLAESLDKLRAESEDALRNAHNKIALLETGRRDQEEALRNAHSKIAMIETGRRDQDPRGERGMQLVDVKTMQPVIFSGKLQESYKHWAKKVKAFCNARKPGFRQALEWAELESTAIDSDSLTALQWDAAEQANSKLYDLLIMLLIDDPLILVENHPNQGFEAWRALSRRYDPVGEQFTFDRMTSLLTRERCKDVGELPAAIERWTRDLTLYERKTGQTLPKEWRVPILFQMVPKANYTEVKSRWQLNADKDITKFAQELVVFANDLKHEQTRGRGPTPMDVDMLHNHEYTDEEWTDYIAECHATVDWIGKGGGKGSKGKKGGKGGKGKGKGKCNWCQKEGHYKTQCREFEQWKKNKDEERKRKGLPPFKPRGVASVERENVNRDENQDDYEGMLSEDLECGDLTLQPGCDACDVEFDLTLDLNSEDGDPELDYVVEVDESHDYYYNYYGPGRRPDKQHNATETSNSYAALADSDTEGEGEPLDVLGVRTPESRTPESKTPESKTPESKPGATGTVATSPWSTKSQESLAESIAREQAELAAKLESTSPTRATSTTPPPIPSTTLTSRPSSLRTPSTSRQKISSTSTSSEASSDNIVEPPGLEEMPTNPWITPSPTTSPSASPRSSRTNTLTATAATSVPAPLQPAETGGSRATRGTMVEAAVQTNVQLDHCVRSITWIPMPDEIEPVHETHDGVLHEPEEQEFEVVNVEPQTDVNDVDHVELEVANEANVEISMVLVNLTMNLVYMVMAMVVAAESSVKIVSSSTAVTTGKKEIAAEELDVDPVGLERKEVSPLEGEDKGRSARQSTSAGLKEKKRMKPGKARLRRGITVDSGSHHNVMPKRLVKQSKIRPSRGSERGLHYVAANKGRIPNEGEVDFDFETEEGTAESWTFQIAEVNKALASIADRVDHGYRVTFDKDEKTGRDASYMIHKKTKKIIKMVRCGNVWRIEAIVDVKNIDDERLEQTFPRRG